MQTARRAGSIILATVATGLISGLGAIGFHYLSDRLGDVVFGWVGEQTATTRLPFVLLVPTIGLGLVGLVLQRHPVSALGGVREVLDSIELHLGIIPLNRILNVILSGFVLAFGGSVGPEGPMVQLGALVGSLVGQRFRLSNDSLQTVVRAGAAAGIAAAFRSPAGGVLLALEVFGARFNLDLASVSVAAGLGYVTRTAVLGDAFPFALQREAAPLPHVSLLTVVPLMGLIAAPTGHIFISMLRRMRALPPHRWPLAARVALGGLIVGAIGIFYPQVMSAGYPVIERAVLGQYGVSLFVILLVLKMVATSVTFGSGAVGGMFAPTLVMGAMYGGAFGFGAHLLFPGVAPQPELFVLLGMIVMFGSIIKGYWSGLLLVADMSGCYHALLLPGIIAGGISFLVSWQLHSESVFGLPLEARREVERVRVAAAGR